MKKTLLFLLFIISQIITNQAFGMKNIISTINPSKEQKEKRLSSQIRHEKAVAQGERKDIFRHLKNLKMKKEYNPIKELNQTLNSYENKKKNPAILTIWSKPSQSKNQEDQESNLSRFKVEDDAEEAHLRQLTLKRLSLSSLTEYVEKMKKFEGKNTPSEKNSFTEKKDMLQKEIDNMNSEVVNIFYKAFFQSEDGSTAEKRNRIKEKLLNQEGWKEKNNEQLINGINAYKEMIRREQYQKVLKKHNIIKFPLRLLLSTIPLFAYLGLKSLFSSAIIQSDIAKNKKNKASKEIDLSIFNKNILEKTNKKNKKVLGDLASDIHPFAQKASDLEYMGRPLTEDEIGTISIIAHQLDILKNKSIKLEENLDELSEDALTQKRSELKMSLALLNQQLFMYELNIRYAPIIKEDGSISQALDQHKDIFQILEKKLEQLNSQLSSENIMQAIKRENENSKQQKNLNVEQELTLLKSKIANINTELTYLNLRMAAEQNIIKSKPAKSVDLPEWEKEFLAKKEDIITVIREAIINDETIQRDRQEPYEASRDRTTEVLLKLKPPYKERTMTKQK